MEEVLVTLKTARMARIKGFNEKVSSWYFGDDEKAHDNPIPYRNDELHITNSSAPTQSLLQKWLREVHQFNIDIETLVSDNLIKYGIEIVYVISTLHIKTLKLRFDSYEDALEFGITEALKMLPDWKP